MGSAKVVVSAPGSDAAVAAGCRCPVIDNGRGAGCGRVGAGGEPLFWLSQDCPLHGSGYRHPRPTPPKAKEEP